MRVDPIKVEVSTGEIKQKIRRDRETDMGAISVPLLLGPVRRLN